MFRSFSLVASTFFISLFLISSCTCRPKTTSQSSDTKTSTTPTTVNLAIWSNYIDEKTIQEFESKTGFKVVLSHYSANEELLAKLQAGASGYDVAVPSDYMVSAMIELNLLEELNKEKITNANEILDTFKNPHYDSEHRFSLPYNSVKSGLAVNSKHFKNWEQVDSWSYVFQNLDKQTRISWLDDARETPGAALKFLGFSLNSANEQELAAAKALLLKAKPNIRSISSEMIDSLTAGDVQIAMMYSSDALQAERKSQGVVKFIVPKEGCTVATDNFVIPKGAKNIEGAHALIQFLLEKKPHAAMVEKVLASPVVKGVFELLPTSIQSHKGLFPESSVTSKCESMIDLGEATALYEQLWTEVKAQP